MNKNGAFVDTLMVVKTGAFSGYFEGLSGLAKVGARVWLRSEVANLQFIHYYAYGIIPFAWKSGGK